MFLTNLFNFKQNCQHDKILPNLDFSYCPDCGKLISNVWYITRCSCCGVKLRTTSRNGKIFPQYHYCSNCGSKEFIVEKLDKINFIDINYAILIKTEIKNEIKTNTTQCWQEKTIDQPKLPVRHL